MRPRTRCETKPLSRWPCHEQALQLRLMGHYEYLDPRAVDSRSSLDGHQSADKQSFAASVQHTCASQQHTCAKHGPRRPRRVSASESRWYEQYSRSPPQDFSHDYSRLPEHTTPSVQPQSRQHWNGRQSPDSVPAPHSSRRVHSPRDIYSPVHPHMPPPPMREMTMSLAPSHQPQYPSQYPTPGPPIDYAPPIHPTPNPMMAPPSEALAPHVNYPNALPSCRFQNDIVPAPGMYGHPRYPTFVKPGEEAMPGHSSILT